MEGERIILHYVSTLGCSVVDYCLVSKEDFEFFSHFEVHTLSELEEKLDYQCIRTSDHSVLSWQVFNHDKQFVHTNKERDEKIPIPDFRKIPPDFLSRYEKDISHLSQLLLLSKNVTQDLIDHVYNSFCHIVCAEIQQKLPLKRFPKNMKQPWWNRSLKNARKEVQQLQKKWLKHKSKKEIATTLKKNFQAAHLKYMYMIRRAKRRHNHMVFFKLLSSISNPKAFWNHSRAISQQKHGRRMIPIEFVQGEDKVPREALLKWENAFRDLLSPQVHSPCQSPPVLSRNNETDQVQQIDISIDEDVTYQAILSQKSGKATGSDRIPSEVLKSKICVRFLTNLFTTVIDSQLIPTAWRQATIVPIPKSSMRDARNPLEYRGISLLSVPYKIFSKILNQLIIEWLEDNDVLAEEQCGFRAGRGTMEQVINLSTIVETRQKMGESTFAAFIDFKKAYDSIQHNLLWYKLKQTMFPTNLLKLLQCVYENMYSCVRVNKWQTRAFHVTQGLRQGCVLSPTLSIFLSTIYLKSLYQLVKMFSSELCIYAVYFMLMI